MGNAQRRIPVVAQVVDVAAELAQRVDQVTNRALVHARHARQLKFAAQQSQRCGERAHGRTCVAQKELGGRLRSAAPQAGDADRAARFVHGAAYLAQRIQHDPRVVGRQQVMHGGGAMAQRSQQQDAVGDAFGAGQVNFTSSSGKRREVEESGAEHGRG
ncbi:hypothetical protein D3C71_1721610 [compost metagenome]